MVGPFAGGALLDFLLRHAVTGVEAGQTRPDGSVHYSRTLGLAHGAATVDLRWDGERLRLVLDADPRDHADALARVRHLVDSTAEPDAVDAHLSRDPALADLVHATPGLRVPGVLDPAEMLIRTLIGQQISLAAARTHGATLSARLGSEAPPGRPELARLFPTPAQFAAVDPTTLPMPRARGRALVGVAERLVDQRLVLDPASDPGEARAQLMACPGIGPWTADYVLMRVWHVPDVLLVSDLVVGRELATLGAVDSTRWSPYRSYATLHLWHRFLQRLPG